jgi:hypothetical protein
MIYEVLLTELFTTEKLIPIKNQVWAVILSGKVRNENIENRNHVANSKYKRLF